LILLDTNICVHIINARPPAGAAALPRLPHGVGLCSVVAAELACGVAKSGSTRNRQALDLCLAPLGILPFDEAALWCCGDLRGDLERQGMPIGAHDALIAAHALSLQASLVTNNLKEFERVPGLLLANRVKPSCCAGQGDEHRLIERRGGVLGGRPLWRV